MTPIQIEALRVLLQHGPQSKALLGNKVYMKPSNLNGLVKGLEDDGLVEDRPDSEDGRRRIISLTDKGFSLIEELLPKHEQLAKAVLAPLREVEQMLFLDMLRRVAYGGELDDGNGNSDSDDQ